MAVIDKDIHYTEIKKVLKKLKGVIIKAGVQVDAGYNKSSGKPVAVVDYAIANEFGTDTIPARPFIGSTFDEQQDKWKGKVYDSFIAILEDPKSIRPNLDKIGFMMAGDIIEKIDTNIPPPNSKETIRRKKSSKTLIDTGKLKGSIKHVVLGG